MGTLRSLQTEEALRQCVEWSSGAVKRSREDLFGGVHQQKIRIAPTNTTR
jgi:hypothetical protein